MTDIQDAVYCLSCRKPMPAAEAACPACGADQQAIRAQRLAPPPARRGRAAATPPPRTETIPCPNCKVNVTPQESRCGYCGHMVDDPEAQSRFDTGYSKVYAAIGICFALFALSPVWWFPRQGIIAAALAVAMGRFAQSENRYDTLGGIAVGMGLVCGLAGFALQFLLISLAARP